MILYRGARGASSKADGKKKAAESSKRNKAKGK